MESKIVAALERLSVAFRAALWQENSAHHLSPIQSQILIFLLFHRAAWRTVTQLAEEFSVTKATMSDAVRVLEEKEIVMREKNPNDARSVILSLTNDGKKIARQVAMFANPIAEQVETMSPKQKSELLTSLLELIDKLQQQGAISRARMCFSCTHFAEQHQGHAQYCKLLMKPLRNADLRLDCPEHHLKETNE